MASGHIKNNYLTKGNNVHASYKYRLVYTAILTLLVLVLVTKHLGVQRLARDLDSGGFSSGIDSNNKWRIAC